MDRDRIQRRGAPQRRPGRRSSSYRKRVGPPPFFILLLALIVLAAAVVVSLLIFGRGKDDSPPESSGLSSSEVSSGISSSLPTPEPSAPAPAQTPPAEKDPSGAPETAEGVLTAGNAGYELYQFAETATNSYITAVCSLGSSLSGSTLYHVVIPTALDVQLSEKYITQHQINSTDQRKAIEYIYSSVNAINPAVKTVPAFDFLKLHNNDYLYFRTDRRWTQLGAYYGYQAFCSTKGLTPVALDQFEKNSYDGFLGSFYDLTNDYDLESDPDTVEAYSPQADASLSYTDSDGNTTSGWPVIVDGEGYDSDSLYYIFCAGNQPYVEITNSDLSDGSACVVVRDSFGSVFIPFLVNHYQHIYAVDYRYYSGSVASLAAEKGAQDVILLSPIVSTCDGDALTDLKGCF